MFFRIVSVFVLVFFYFANATNILEKASMQRNSYEFDFKNSLSSEDIKSFVLDNPRREVFDIYDTQIGPNLDTNGIPKGSGVIIAQNSPTKTRIVIYSEVDSTNVIRDKYIINIKPNTLSATPNLSSSSNGDETKSKSSFKSSSSNYQKSGSLKIDGQVIVVDAGHGGKDPGAVSGGKQEKDATLAVAKKLGSILASMGFTVYLTRDDDRFITLKQRTQIADKKDAKIFVSLHCNALTDESYSGVETYFLQNSKDAKSQAIAARENASVLQGTDSKSKQVILDTVLSGPKIVLSNKLAIDVQNSIIGSMSVRDDGVRSAPFWVLVGASRPSILVEMGYITNPAERERLFDSSYQSQLANAIANGIVRYLKNQQAEIGY